MKNSNKIFLSFGLFLSMSFLNTIFAQSTKPPRASIAKYYLHKNQAEIAIVDSQYTKASTYYKQAFRYKSPNSRDLYNAFAVSYLINDTANAKKYFETLVLKGQDKDFFEHTPFGKIIHLDPFYLLIAKNYDSLRKISEAGMMPKYAKTMNEIFEMDQAPRNDKNDPNYNTCDKADSITRKKMLQFITNHGFPSFDLIGLYPERYRQVDDENPIWLLLWHARGSNTILDSIVYNAVMDGNYLPDEYAFVMDTKKLTYCVGFLERKLKGLSKEELTIIDKNRQSIYLEPLTEYKRKLKFSTHDHRFLLFSQWIYGFSQEQ